MFKFLIVAIFSAIAGYAFAQSTATPVQMGALVTSGGFSTWQPYSAANPIYFTSN